MITHLLDTDVVIDALRRRTPSLRQRLHDVAGDVCVSIVTVFELSLGASRSSVPAQNHAAVGDLLARLHVLDFDSEAAAHAGDIRAELARVGESIGAYDVMIAGHARSRGLVVATGNVREFGRVPGLRAESWRDH